jgi:hypothetical protein
MSDLQVCFNEAQYSPILVNQSYRIRRKKCDEANPACSQCSNTGRHCDFSLSKPNHRIGYSSIVLERRTRVSLNLLSPSLPYHLHNLTHIQASHFDYFRHVCARDFVVCFDSTPWESLVLQNAYLEPSIYHAALAIAALSRHHYSPGHAWYDPGDTISAFEFSMIHYSLAIQALNGKFEESVGKSKLAVLASILFIHIEAFQGFQNIKESPNLISAHLKGGYAILKYLKSLSQDIDYLETGLNHIRDQILQFEQISA